MYEKRWDHRSLREGRYMIYVGIVGTGGPYLGAKTGALVGGADELQKQRWGYG